jgi:histidinol-phosphatase (PHP family)
VRGTGGLPPGLADYHTHSCFSDGEGAPADLARRAEELGLSELGICDHLVPAAYDEPGYGVEHGRLSEYARAVREAAVAVPGVRVLLGLEIDFVPGTESEIASLLECLRLDYALVSVHIVDGFDLADEQLRFDRRWRDADAVFGEYYRLVARAAAWAAAPMIGMAHPDVCTRHGHAPSREPVEERDAALTAIARAGLAVEVNTNGCAWPSPDQEWSRRLVRRARELGIPLTLGSDAHTPAEVGAGFADAVGEARAAGYSTYLRLSDRTEVPLP